QARLAGRCLVLDQRVEHRLVAGPDLAEEQRIHHLRGPHRCASASRSLAGSADRSALSSVGANLAVWRCNSAAAASDEGACDDAWTPREARVATNDADATAMDTLF